ncbi:hypothetical protein E4M16_07585 [Ligilactobacillus ruminis]|uniref:hypothetical protein n=1 Tax=Ligilactobacillus ruminis TaxID=1623 RepID=UPI001081673F|nr:hypothetical protein [Ligilactobacillus ruminis]TGJ60458.1 hypothetical protein E4M16_07585 [Ligilactobacillus ruminis]
MANIIQKLLYFFSAVAPVCITFSVVLIIQGKGIILPIILASVSMIGIVLFIISFRYGYKSVAPMTIRVTDVSTFDLWILGYIFSYLLPLANMVIEEWNLFILVGISLIIIVVIPFMNSAIPHPLLFFKGYHFYNIATENGISSYILISKKQIRNKKDIRVVGRIFEFLLIDK